MANAMTIKAIDSTLNRDKTETSWQQKPDEKGKLYRRRAIKTSEPFRRGNIRL